MKSSRYSPEHTAFGLRQAEESTPRRSLGHPTPPKFIQTTCCT